MLNPIFITGIERSGSSIIAKALYTTGNVFFGQRTGRFENKAIRSLIELYLINNQMDPQGQYPVPLTPLPVMYNMDKCIEEELYAQGYTNTYAWCLKSSLLLHSWKTWVALYPNARWLFIRRKPDSIINSCFKTEYMRAYESNQIRKHIGVRNVSEGWRYWIRWGESQMAAIMKEGVTYREVWPDRLADGDYSQLVSVIDQLDLEWNDKIIPTISRLF